MLFILIVESFLLNAESANYSAQVSLTIAQEAYSQYGSVFLPSYQAFIDQQPGTNLGGTDIGTGSCEVPGFRWQGDARNIIIEEASSPESSWDIEIMEGYLHVSFQIWFTVGYELYVECVDGATGSTIKYNVCDWTYLQASFLQSVTSDVYVHQEDGILKLDVPSSHMFVNTDYVNQEGHCDSGLGGAINNIIRDMIYEKMEELEPPKLKQIISEKLTGLSTNQTHVIWTPNGDVVLTFRALSEPTFRKHDFVLLAFSLIVSVPALGKSCPYTEPTTMPEMTETSLGVPLTVWRFTNACYDCLAWAFWILGLFDFSSMSQKLDASFRYHAQMEAPKTLISTGDLFSVGITQGSAEIECLVNGTELNPGDTPYESVISFNFSGLQFQMRVSINRSALHLHLEEGSMAVETVHFSARSPVVNLQDETAKALFLTGMTQFQEAVNRAFDSFQFHLPQSVRQMMGSSPVLSNHQTFTELATYEINVTIEKQKSDAIKANLETVCPLSAPKTASSTPDTSRLTHPYFSSAEEIEGYWVLVTDVRMAELALCGGYRAYRFGLSPTDPLSTPWITSPPTQVIWDFAASLQEVAGGWRYATGKQEDVETIEAYACEGGGGGKVAAFGVGCGASPGYNAPTAMCTSPLDALKGSCILCQDVWGDPFPTCGPAFVWVSNSCLESGQLAAVDVWPSQVVIGGGALHAVWETPCPSCRIDAALVPDNSRLWLPLHRNLTHNGLASFTLPYLADPAERHALCLSLHPGEEASSNCSESFHVLPPLAIVFPAECELVNLNLNFTLPLTLTPGAFTSHNATVTLQHIRSGRQWILATDLPLSSDDLGVMRLDLGLPADLAGNQGAAWLNSWFRCGLAVGAAGPAVDSGTFVLLDAQSALQDEFLSCPAPSAVLLVPVHRISWSTTDAGWRDLYDSFHLQAIGTAHQPLRLQTPASLAAFDWLGQPTLTQAAPARPSDLPPGPFVLLLVAFEHPSAPTSNPSQDTCSVNQLKNLTLAGLEVLLQSEQARVINTEAIYDLTCTKPKGISHGAVDWVQDHGCDCSKYVSGTITNPTWGLPQAGYQNLVADLTQIYKDTMTQAQILLEDIKQLETGAELPCSEYQQLLKDFYTLDTRLHSPTVSYSCDWVYCLYCSGYEWECQPGECVYASSDGAFSYPLGLGLTPLPNPFNSHYPSPAPKMGFYSSRKCELDGVWQIRFGSSLVPFGWLSVVEGQAIFTVSDYGSACESFKFDTPQGAPTYQHPSELDSLNFLSTPSQDPDRLWDCDPTTKGAYWLKNGDQTDVTNVDCFSMNFKLKSDGCLPRRALLMDAELSRPRCSLMPESTWLFNTTDGHTGYWSFTEPNAFTLRVPFLGEEEFGSFVLDEQERMRLFVRNRHGTEAFACGDDWGEYLFAFDDVACSSFVVLRKHDPCSRRAQVLHESRSTRARSCLSLQGQWVPEAGQSGNESAANESLGLLLLGTQSEPDLFELRDVSGWLVDRARFNYSQDVLTVTSFDCDDLLTGTSSILCASGSTGRYRPYASANCQTLRMRLLEDECSGRAGLLSQSDMTLIKDPARTTSLLATQLPHPIMQIEVRWETVKEPGHTYARAGDYINLTWTQSATGRSVTHVQVYLRGLDQSKLPVVANQENSGSVLAPIPAGTPSGFYHACLNFAHSDICSKTDIYLTGPAPKTTFVFDFRVFFVVLASFFLVLASFFLVLLKPCLKHNNINNINNNNNNHLLPAVAALLPRSLTLVLVAMLQLTVVILFFRYSLPVLESLAGISTQSRVESLLMALDMEYIVPALIAVAPVCKQWDLVLSYELELGYIMGVLLLISLCCTVVGWCCDVGRGKVSSMLMVLMDATWCTGIYLLLASPLLWLVYPYVTDIDYEAIQLLNSTSQLAAEDAQGNVSNLDPNVFFFYVRTGVATWILVSSLSVIFFLALAMMAGYAFSMLVLFLPIEQRRGLVSARITLAQEARRSLVIRCFTCHFMIPAVTLLQWVFIIQSLQPVSTSTQTSLSKLFWPVCNFLFFTSGLLTSWLMVLFHSNRVLLDMPRWLAALNMLVIIAYFGFYWHFLYRIAANTYWGEIPLLETTWFDFGQFAAVLTCISLLFAVCFLREAMLPFTLHGSSRKASPNGRRRIMPDHEAKLLDNCSGSPLIPPQKEQPGCVQAGEEELAPPAPPPVELELALPPVELEELAPPPVELEELAPPPVELVFFGFLCLGLALAVFKPLFWPPLPTKDSVKAELRALNLPDLVDGPTMFDPGFAQQDVLRELQESSCLWSGGVLLVALGLTVVQRKWEGRKERGGEGGEGSGWRNWLRHLWNSRRLGAALTVCRDIAILAISVPIVLAFGTKIAIPFNNKIDWQQDGYVPCGPRFFEAEQIVVKYIIAVWTLAWLLGTFFLGVSFIVVQVARSNKYMTKYLLSVGCPNCKQNTPSPCCGAATRFLSWWTSWTRRCRDSPSAGASTGRPIHKGRPLKPCTSCGYPDRADHGAPDPVSEALKPTLHAMATLTQAVGCFAILIAVPILLPYQISGDYRLLGLALWFILSPLILSQLDPSPVMLVFTLVMVCRVVMGLWAVGLQTLLQHSDPRYPIFPFVLDVLVWAVVMVIFRKKPVDQMYWAMLWGLLITGMWITWWFNALDGDQDLVKIIKRNINLRTVYELCEHISFDVGFFTLLLRAPLWAVALR